VRSVAVSPDFAKDETVMAGGVLGEAFISMTAGRSFKEMEARFDGDTVADVKFSPSFGSDETIAAGTVGNRRAALHRSVDGGKTWRRWVQHGTDAEWISCFFPSDYTGQNNSWYFTAENQVFKPARRFRQVWSGTKPAGTKTAILSLTGSPDFEKEAVLFVGGSDGVFRSHDRGLTWEEINDGLSNKSVLQVAVSPAYEKDRLVYLVGLGGEIWRYQDVPASRSLKKTEAKSYT